MKKFFLLFICAVSLNYFFGCSSGEALKIEKIKSKAESFKKDFKKTGSSFTIPASAKIDTININDAEKNITVSLSEQFSYLPFRENNVKDIYSVFSGYFDEEYNGYSISIRTLNHDIKDLVPNYYRKNVLDYDYTRLPVVEKRPLAVITNISKKYLPVNGLLNRNILIWHSHGWYYDNDEDRWKWQRPRIYESVEDLLPMSFVIPYLIPMLQNAGANVFVPRERDIQSNEVVVDNDLNSEIFYLEKNSPNHKWKTGMGAGFSLGDPPYEDNYNPFKGGTYRITKADSSASSQVSWIPSIPKTGYYSVYISYASSDSNISDAHYSVYHAGGKTDFIINQKIGGYTWQYLGKFKFFEGYNRENGKVVLTNQSIEPNNKFVSADAVRFGGGMGIIARNGKVSGRPKFVEGSRYWLQYAGMPDTLVYNLNDNKNDYNDDYQSRAEYGNYLYGAPFGPNKNRNVKGLGIPIDLSLAFHTDAGITKNDTTVGTLSIYSIEDFDTSKIFPNGVSRLANRDLADIIQTQIVNDIKFKYDTAWTRRALMDAKYSEAARPNMPSLLLELLSHQNFLDMKFAKDPRFKFDAARSIYKGMLRFLSVQYNFDYVIQPLPVDHFSSELNDSVVTLSWKPVNDPLEPSAKPDKYIVYTRIEDGGFDNGRLVDSAYFSLKIDQGKIYSFKVTAVNNGGESFPSEILSVCWLNNKPPALIINGFDRISASASIETSKFSGFLSFIDEGVPDKYSISYTGSQNNFNPESEYISNDAPGHGASHAGYETKIIAGNTFDFPFIHGESLKANGFSFVSSSDEAVMDSTININNYKFVDLILGEEKQTHWERSYFDSLNGIQFKAFPKKLQKQIEYFCNAGGNLFISGSYIGSDIFMNGDSSDINFATEYLKFKWDSDHAAKTGKLISNNKNFFAEKKNFSFNQELNDSIYAAEAPDAVTNVQNSEIILRYQENQFPAAVAYKKDYGVIVFGFPFETILSKEERILLMKEIINYLKI